MIACKDLIGHLSEIQQFSQELGQATQIAVDAEESKDSSIISRTEKLLNVIKLRAVVANRIQRLGVIIMVKNIAGESVDFKKVEVGNGPKTANDFFQVLREKKIRVSIDAVSTMKRPEFKISNEKKDIDLVVLTASELGFNGITPLNKIYDFAEKLGLKLCPPEVGPQVALIGSDISLFFCMKPIDIGPIKFNDGTTYYHIFYLPNQQIFHTKVAYINDKDWIAYDADNKFVFTLPEKIFL